MLVHSVYFWLRPDASSGQRGDFIRALESLARIQSVDKLYVGTPAATEEGSHVDHSFSFALTVLFKDVAAHDDYQVDPIHWAFVKEFEGLWTRVMVYDAA